MTYSYRFREDVIVLHRFKCRECTFTRKNKTLSDALIIAEKHARAHHHKWDIYAQEHIAVSWAATEPVPPELDPAPF